MNIRIYTCLYVRWYRYQLEVDVDDNDTPNVDDNDKPNSLLW